MSATSSAAGSGAVLGIVLVFLLQQFGAIALSDIVTALVYFVLAAVLGGLLFGLITWAVARRAQRPA